MNLMTVKPPMKAVNLWIWVSVAALLGVATGPAQEPNAQPVTPRQVSSREFFAAPTGPIPVETAPAGKHGAARFAAVEKPTRHHP